MFSEPSNIASLQLFLLTAYKKLSVVPGLLRAGSTQTIYKHDNRWTLLPIGK